MLEVVEDDGSFVAPNVRGDNSVADNVDNISTLWFITWVKSVREKERPLEDCPSMAGNADLLDRPFLDFLCRLGEPSWDVSDLDFLLEVWNKRNKFLEHQLFYSRVPNKSRDYGYQILTFFQGLQSYLGTYIFNS